MSVPDPRLVKVPAASYKFGEFTLDLIRGFLLRGDQEINLRPKSFEALKYLVQHQGRLVGRVELMGALWPDSFVSDDSVAHCIMEVRRALGEGRQFIRT